MAVNMKESIAEAARRLLLGNKIKKLTVKDIVEECHITRQAFYYHFEDIPELLRWILESGKEQMLNDIRSCDNPEKWLRCCFIEAISINPYIRKGMDTNYRSDIERLLSGQIYSLLEQMVDESIMYQTYGRTERNLIFRYHSRAIMGILWEWTEEDNKNLDTIVHQIYLLLTGQMPTFIRT